jgi:hypothetical protein
MIWEEGLQSQSVIPRGGGSYDSQNSMQFLKGVNGIECREGVSMGEFPADGTRLPKR